ncbi:MAG: exopolysaccharide biosynthesis protein, partial [Proteobacteria bacterium]|nr:exopolysaccharide biosynthesis protein [Pseudomonadota bacterium]
HLLEEVKTRYADRYIIVDSPPPQLTAETGAIARQVDGIIIVVKFGSTRREMVEDMLEKLGKEKILGVIINRFDIQSKNYGYGKYGNYGKYRKYYGK